MHARTTFVFIVFFSNSCYVIFVNKNDKENDRPFVHKN